jgi:hypothetical protein
MQMADLSHGKELENGSQTGNGSQNSRLCIGKTY